MIYWVSCWLRKLDENPIPGQTILDIQKFLSLCAMPMQIYRLTVLKNWRVEQLAIVRKVSDKIANITDLDHLCELITDAVQEKFQYYYVAIFTCENDCTLLCRSSASMAWPANQAPQIEVVSGQGISWVGG